MSKKRNEQAIETGGAFSPNGKNAFKLGFINSNISHLLGEILTIMDASLDGDKNKAVKDLIRDKFSRKQEWFSEAAWKDIPQGSNTLGTPLNMADSWETGVVRVEGI